MLITKIPVLDNKKEDSSFSQTEFSPDEDDRFSVMVTISQKEGQNPYAYFLLGFDAFKYSLTVTRLSTKTALSQQGQPTVILNEVYTNSKIDGVLNEINRFFSLKINRYIEFTNESFMGFLELFDSVVIDSPQKLSEINRQKDIYIKIDKGKQILSSVGFIDYLSTSAFKNGEKEVVYEGSKAVYEFFKQNHRIIIENLNKAEEYILQNTKNNLSITDIENRRDIIVYLLKDSGESVSFLYPEGSMQTHNTVFYLTDKSIKNITERYS